MPTPSLSVVIPTFQEGERIGRTLAALTGALTPEDEILVCDSGSTDGTLEQAREAGARIVTAPRGRGPQTLLGGKAAERDWILFLHADTRPAEGWRAAVGAFASDAANAERAAVFRFTLDDDGPQARRVERLTRWRGRTLGLPYGDQGLLISRATYETIGGHRPYPMMEDVEIVRRLGKRRISELPVDGITSAIRYRRDGWWLRPLRNSTLISLYLLGLPPCWVAKLYE